MIALAKRLIVSVFKILDSFFNDDTTYYAASLSFFTIFSLLPILALFISIISYLDITAGYMDLFLNYIMDILNPTKSEQFRDFIISFLSNANKLGMVGIFYMIFVFGMFFKDYEYIVTKIHGAQRRGFVKAAFLYLASLFVLPTIFIVFIVVSSFVEQSIVVKALSFLFAWFLMFIIFKVSSSYSLNLGAVVISSLSTTVVLSITKNLFVYYVIYNKTYTTIYGSFSTLLFFFFWIYISWLIYLYGIKFCNELHKQFSISSEN